jgi:hypothetical protein
MKCALFRTACLYPMTSPDRETRAVMPSPLDPTGLRDAWSESGTKPAGFDEQAAGGLFQ